MVTTRSSTNSLPAKRPAENESLAPAQKSRCVSSSSAAPNSTKKPKARARGGTKAEPESDEPDDSSFEDGASGPDQVETSPINVATTKSKKRTTKKSAARDRAKAKVSQPIVHPAETPTANSQKSLMNLPAELRNEIYSLALVQDTRIMVSTSLPYLKEPALLAVNRQMRSETLPVWYSENVFQINGSSPSVKFLRSLGSERLQLLKTLRISTGEQLRMDYAEERIRQLIRAFGSDGLAKETIRFTVAQWPSVWLTLADIKRIKREDAATAATLASVE